MIYSRRVMIFASVACMALSLSGCKKNLKSQTSLTNATTNVVIVSINAQAGPAKFIYGPPSAAIGLATTVGPVSQTTLSNKGDQYAITGTAVIIVGAGLPISVTLPAVTGNYQIGKSNTITVSGTAAIDGSGLTIANVAL